MVVVAEARLVTMSLSFGKTVDDGNKLKLSQFFNLLQLLKTFSKEIDLQ